MAKTNGADQEQKNQYVDIESELVMNFVKAMYENAKKGPHALLRRPPQMITVVLTISGATVRKEGSSSTVVETLVAEHRRRTRNIAADLELGVV